MKLVSVIITTYKGSKFLKRAIDSVLNQTYDLIEIIIVDDNNPDTNERILTENVLKNYEHNKKVHYVKHTCNRNGAVARNSGIKIAKGEYITFLDDDDLMIKDRVKKSVEKLENNLEYDAVFCDVLYTDEKLNPKGIIKVREQGDCQKSLMLSSMFMGTGSNIFITRKAINKLECFDESFIRHQDVEFMIRFYDYFKSTYVNGIYIIKSKNLTNNVPDYKKLKSVKELFFTKFKINIEKLNEEDKKTFYSLHYSDLLYAAYASRDSLSIKESEILYKSYANLSINMKILCKLYYHNSLNSKVVIFLKKIRTQELRKKIYRKLDEDIKEVIDYAGNN